MIAFGWGVLRGMAVTLKNFLCSYVAPPDRGGLFTVEYPEKRIALREKFRNFPFLVFDETPENLRCVACESCARECPPKCIAIEKERDAAGKPVRRPAVFSVDLGLCMNCGICEAVCPFDAIFMDHDYEISGCGRRDTLLYSKERLAKPVAYLHKIRPEDARAVEQKRRAAEEKKKAALAAARAKGTQEKDGKSKEARP